MPSSQNPLIIGIGASAGGLKALQKFFDSVPVDLPIAYFVIQHLDPNHSSMLSELLGKNTMLKVVDASDNTSISSGHVYIIPPAKYMEISSSMIRITPKKELTGKRTAIDHFFRSLARQCGEKCVGIILSGSGSDGTAGLREIKAAGGLTLAQNPQSAEHQGMPKSAIQAGAIDKVALVEEMPSLLLNYIKHPLALKEEKQLVDKISNNTLERVTEILAIHEKFELSQYKPNTIYRRITRRMSLTGFKDYYDYIQELERNADERKQLTEDLLINVTDFFRDKEAFEVLQKQVIPDIIKKVDKGEDIRVWVAGCASGEEAYSIAIVILEAIEKHNIKNELKIFATDIDEGAIKLARKGVYPSSIIKEIPENYIGKYFIDQGNGTYQIKSTVRDLISFAHQNVASHPPFSHMHLISCRNLLIYVRRKVQEKILNAFYFALEGDSFLFLGSSETISNKTDFFRSVSKKWRIYRKIPGRDKETLLLHHLHLEKNSPPTLSIPSYSVRKSKDELSSRIDLMRIALLDAQLSASVIIDESGEILYYHGNLKPFMNFPMGEPQNNIMQLIHSDIRSRLRGCLYKLRKNGQKQIFHCSLAIREEPNTQSEIIVKLSILPNQKFTEGQAILITFTESSEIIKDRIDLPSEEEQNINRSLEIELSETKEELQNTIEELESSTEELKASHEEALSTNEELQSANEELEAGSEELRSLNEELSTVNNQLKEKIELLQQTNNDINNFFSSTDIPTLFLNTKLEIQRYTPATENLLKIGSQDIDRPISSLGRDLVDDNLVEECHKVLKNFQPIQKEKAGPDDKWYIRRITPYRTEELKIEGVVISFQDITEVKQLSKRAEARERQQLVVAQLGMMALEGAEPEEMMHQAIRQVAHVLNADYAKILKYQPEEHNLLLIAGTGWNPNSVGHITVPDDYNSQAGYTLLSKEPIIVKNLSEEKRFKGPELLLKHNVVSGISCLINHTKPPFGIIAVHTTTYREFTSEDAHFLQSVANMISTALKTREHQEKLHASEEQFKTISNSIPQLAWIADPSGYVYWYNHRWYDYTGTSKEEMEGWKWKSVHKKEEVDRIIEKFKLHINNEEEWEDTFQLRAADGTYRWFLSRAKPVKDKHGKVLSWLGTNTDISEHLELENSLRNVIKELENTDQRKNEFLAVLGHELRNPLASLQAGIELLDTEQLPAKKIIDILGRSVSSIGRLLDDLLDLSRISRKKIDLKPEIINISEHLNQCLTSLKGLMDQKKQTISVHINRGIYIYADPLRLEQIFVNILTNAHKYSHEGGKIHVDAWQEREAVYIKIEDNGIGIPVDKQEEIFKDFYQIPQTGKAAAGLGIGLALVKHLVSLHKGEVRVESKGYGHGACFTLTFPAKQAPSNFEPNKMKVHLAEENPKDAKIVLIEDNPDISLMMRMILETLTCEVFSANNGLDGTKLIIEEKPDISFIDIGLPDITGYEIAMRLRKKKYNGILLALSGYSHQAARVRSLESGFNDHLAKPLGKEQIVSIFRKYIWNQLQATST
ncbi:chemotaxis protein CheB [Fulvivirga ligni]|uniref:chemotaxis protein CheB n=1 Tax=Fulvivirga ligni TaxID=2904246 RepID=UPI001F2AE0AF|nr:chemotaxis protein CheB [Fulvivirga ligni]UII20794.1 PAS domain-containing protein [Fulvivirga ligni]